MEAKACIKYDYLKGREKPAEVFQSMAIYIEAYGDFLELLAESMGGDGKHTYTLEFVEEGSIRSFVEWLQEKSVKLVNVDGAAKATFEDLTESEEVGRENKIEDIARKAEDALERDNPDETNRPVIEPSKLAYVMEKFAAANELAMDGEEVTIAPSRRSEFSVVVNSGWKFSTPASKLFQGREEEKEDVFHLEPIVSVFKGNQEWAFKVHELGRRENFKIKDKEWLEKYQSGQVGLGPGSSILARVSYKVLLKKASGSYVEIPKLHGFKVVKVLDVYPEGYYQYFLEPKE